jgi:hypothetical protein
MTSEYFGPLVHSMSSATNALDRRRKRVAKRAPKRAARSKAQFQVYPLQFAREVCDAAKRYMQDAWPSSLTRAMLD